MAIVDIKHTQAIVDIKHSQTIEEMLRGGGGLEFAEVTIRIDGIDASATAQGIDGVGLMGDAFIRTDGGQIILTEGAFSEDNAIYKRPNSESSGTALYPKNVINGMDIFAHTLIKFVFSGSSQLGDLAEYCYIEMTSQNCLDEETMAVISDGYIGYTLYFGD